MLTDPYGKLSFASGREPGHRDQNINHAWRGYVTEKVRDLDVVVGIHRPPTEHPSKASVLFNTDMIFVWFAVLSITLFCIASIFCKTREIYREHSKTPVENFTICEDIACDDRRDTPPRSPGCRHIFADRMKRPGFCIPYESRSPEIPGTVQMTNLVPERYLGASRSLNFDDAACPSTLN